jgi:long-chain acyl-CoA synthetase
VPQYMENKVKVSRFVEQIMVIGEGEKFPGALIVPNMAVLKDWAKREGITIDHDNNVFIKTKAVRDRIQDEIALVNETLGSWEKIKRFELIATEWSVQGTELTPTLKLKRKVIMEKYADLVKEVYLNDDRE